MRLHRLVPRLPKHTVTKSTGFEEQLIEFLFFCFCKEEDRKTYHTFVSLSFPPEPCVGQGFVGGLAGAGTGGRHGGRKQGCIPGLAGSYKDGLGNLKKMARKCQRRVTGEQVSTSPCPTGGGGRTGGSRGRHSSWRGTLGTPEEAARCSGTWASDARTPQTLPKHLLCARRWGRSGEQGSPVLAPLSIVMEATTMQKQASKKKKKKAF